MDDSFASFSNRLVKSEPAAAEEVVRRYSAELVRLVSPRIAGVIRSKVDPEDLVQSAFKSFFRRNAAGAFEFDSWNSLWSLLATLAIRKSRYQVRQWTTGKRHIHREENHRPSDNHCNDFDFVASEPSPLEAATLGDLVEQFLGGLEGKTLTIAELALQGLSAAEIAPRVRLTERSVYRQMERIRAHLQGLSMIENC